MESALGRRRCLMSYALSDAESRNGHPVEDDGGDCGKWGFFGYDVMLMKGRTGKWFCSEHHPADEAELGPQLPLLIEPRCTRLPKTLFSGVDS